MLEEGENEGAIKLLITPIRGRDMVVLEVMVRVLPLKAQLRPEGREHDAPEAVNYAGKVSLR